MVVFGFFVAALGFLARDEACGQLAKISTEAERGMYLQRSQ